jgi:hypothetical protein
VPKGGTPGREEARPPPHSEGSTVELDARTAQPTRTAQTARTAWLARTPRSRTRRRRGQWSHPGSAASGPAAGDARPRCGSAGRWRSPDRCRRYLGSGTRAAMPRQPGRARGPPRRPSSPHFGRPCVHPPQDRHSVGPTMHLTAARGNHLENDARRPRPVPTGHPFGCAAAPAGFIGCSGPRGHERTSRG